MYIYVRHRGLGSDLSDTGVNQLQVRFKLRTRSCSFEAPPPCTLVQARRGGMKAVLSCKDAEP